MLTIKRVFESSKEFSQFDVNDLIRRKVSTLEKPEFDFVQSELDLVQLWNDTYEKGKNAELIDLCELNWDSEDLILTVNLPLSYD